MRIAITILLLVAMVAGYLQTQSHDSPPQFESNATVLISELAAGICSEFVLRNEDTNPKTLTLKGVSCHCVSVMANGMDVATTESIEIAGGTDCVIEMTVRPNPKPGNISQEALFDFGTEMVCCRQRANILTNVTTEENAVELVGETRSIVVGSRFRTEAPELKVTTKKSLAKIASIEPGKLEAEGEIKTQYWNVLIQRTGPRQRHQVGRDQLQLRLGGGKQLRVVSLVVPSESGFDAPEVMKFGGVRTGESYQRSVSIKIPCSPSAPKKITPTVSAPFELAKHTLSPDGEALECTVCFRPDDAKVFQGTLTLHGLTETVEIALKGKGVRPRRKQGISANRVTADRKTLVLPTRSSF